MTDINSRVLEAILRLRGLLDEQIKREQNSREICDDLERWSNEWIKDVPVNLPKVELIDRISERAEDVDITTIEPTLKKIREMIAEITT